LDKLDSAIIYLDSSLNLAKKRNQLVWIAINSGYKGEVLFKQQEYQKAKPWLEYDYAYNKNDLTNLAAKSLQWMARINLLERKNDSALLKAKESLRLIRNAKYKYLLQPSRTLELCYFTLAQAYEAVDNADSFYHYTHLSTRLHDSIQEVAFLSSSRIVQMKLSDEKKQRTIEKLQNEKRNEVVTRNLILVAILLLSVIGIIYVKQTKLKQRHREEIALKEKTIAETQLAAAKERMQQFTENIVEKSNLIEKLNQQLSGNDTNGETQQVLKELTNTTILTEGDWENFKKVFEKIYPRFFIYLKEKAPGITVAEQRMAALTRLQLTNRQMASMLGISVDSVHKTRQRLRQRLRISPESSLEEIMVSI